MRPDCGICVRAGIRLLPLLVTLVVSLYGRAVPAQPFPLEVQTQLRYDWFSTKFAGQPADSDGHFTTGYNLLFRRPARPFTNFISDLSFNTYESANRGSRQSTRNWIMNVFNRGPNYTLTGRVSKDHYNSSFVGQPLSTIGKSTNYSLGLLLTQPAYPVLNLQYLQQKSDSTYGPFISSYETITRLVGSYYDFAPFRVTYDSSDQRYSNSSGFGGGATKTSRSSLQLDRSITNALRFFGEVSRQDTNSRYAGGSSSTDVERRLARLTATPIPAIVTDLEYVTQDYGQNTAFGSNNTRSKSLSLGFRSQVLPELFADYTQQVQTLEGGGRFGVLRSTERSRTLSLNGALSNNTIGSATWSKLNYHSLPFAETSQDSIQFGAQTVLSARTDLNVDFGTGTADVIGSSSYDSKFANISLRDRSTNQLSTGISYRWSESQTKNADLTLYNQRFNAVDANALWTPSYDLGLNFTVGYQSNNGTSPSDSFTASSNIRWQIDTQTNLNVYYSTQRNRQYDFFLNAINGQRSGGLGFRMTHSFLDRSVLDVTYDYRGDNFGGLDWQKQLSVIYTLRL